MVSISGHQSLLERLESPVAVLEGLAASTLARSLVVTDRGERDGLVASVLRRLPNARVLRVPQRRTRLVRLVGDLISLRLVFRPTLTVIVGCGTFVGAVLAATASESCVWIRGNPGEAAVVGWRAAMTAWLRRGEPAEAPSSVQAHAEAWAAWEWGAANDSRWLVEKAQRALASGQLDLQVTPESEGGVEGVQRLRIRVWSRSDDGVGNPRVEPPAPIEIVVLANGEALPDAAWLRRMSMLMAVTSHDVLIRKPGPHGRDDEPGAAVACRATGLARAGVAPYDMRWFTPRACELEAAFVRRGAYLMADVNQSRQVAAADGCRLELPEVSICIPARDAGGTLARAIDSALIQRGVRIEVCVCDDGSTDRTLEVLRAYERENVQVRSSRIPAQGISAAWNALIDLAKGEYLLQLDADDELLPDAARHLFDVACTDDRISLVYGGYEIVDEAGYLHGIETPSPFDDVRHLAGNIVGHPRLMRARDLHRCGGFDRSVAAAVDYDISLRLREWGRLVAVPKVLYRYYVHPRSVSNRHPAEQERLRWRGRDAALARRASDPRLLAGSHERMRAPLAAGSKRGT